MCTARPTALALALLALLGTTAWGERAPADRSDAALRFPTFGVALAAPDGWSRGPVNSPGRIVSFGLPAGKAHKPDQSDKPDDEAPAGEGAEQPPPARAPAADRIVAVLNVDVSWVDVPTLADFADRQMDGGVWAVTDPDATLGGAPAVRLRATAARGLALRHADMMAAVHDGRLYLVTSMDTAGRAARPEFEALCESWRWVAPESPARHLEFRDAPFPVLGGLLSLNAPAVLRPAPTENPKRHAKLIAYNLAEGTEELVVDIGIVKKPPGQSLDEFRGAVSAGLRRQFKLKSPPAWEERQGSPPRSATPAVGASVQGSRVRFRLVMVDADRGRLVLLHFRVATDSAEHRAAYEAAVEKIIDSIGAGAKWRRGVVER